MRAELLEDVASGRNARAGVGEADQRNVQVHAITAWANHAEGGRIATAQLLQHRRLDGGVGTAALLLANLIGELDGLAVIHHQLQASG